MNDTIEQVYALRMAYHALIVREWAMYQQYAVHKSWRHHDGEQCFGDPDWFIVVAMLSTGQISNHYHRDYWDFFQCPEVPKALYPYDGHETDDVTRRIVEHLRNGASNA
jgi:hypothetical protein